MNAKLEKLWYQTHSDFRLTLNGQRCVLVCRKGMTQPVALTDLTEQEVADRLPKRGAA